MANTKVVFDIELEYGRKSVTYEVRAEVSPEEAQTGPSMSDPGHPGSPAEVEVKEVWYLWEKKCDTFYFSEEYKTVHPTGCKCKGRMKVKCAERRPELDDLVDDEEVMKNLPDEPDYGPDDG